MDAITWLKHKYVIGRAYKNQKSPSGHAGKSKNKVTIKTKPLLGTAVMNVNMSGNEELCAGTGKVLPLRGIIYSHEGKLYVSRRAIKQ